MPAADSVDSTTSGTASGQAASPPPDLAALQAEVAALRADKTKLIAENVAKKAREREAQETAAKLAAEQGDFKAQLEIERKRREELEPMEAQAKRWQEHEAAELARFAEVRATLPEGQQKALDAVQGIDAKRAVLDAFGATKPAATGTKPAAAGGAPPAAGLRIDFEAAIKDDTSQVSASAFNAAINYARANNREKALEYCDLAAKDPDRAKQAAELRALIVK